MPTIYSENSTEAPEISSDGVLPKNSMKQWDRALLGVRLPAQSYSLQEAQKRTKFLFKKSEAEKRMEFVCQTVDAHIAALGIEPRREHNFAMEALGHVFNQCWLETEESQAISAKYALLHFYLHQVLGQSVPEVGSKIESALQGLAQLREEIEQLGDLQDDWDTEGAMAVEPSAITNAINFVSLLAPKMSHYETNWTFPSAEATLDGGVLLYWFTRWGQTSLSFYQQSQHIYLQKKPRNGDGWNGSVSFDKAIDEAVRAMRDA